MGIFSEGISRIIKKTEKENMFMFVEILIKEIGSKVKKMEKEKCDMPAGYI